MTQVRNNGTKPLHTGHLRQGAHPSGGSPAAAPHHPGTDSLRVSRAATANLAHPGGFPKTYSGAALYATGASSGAEDSQINKALDGFISDFKKLSPAEQKQLLDNPKFSITVTGVASNLGMASGFNNHALSVSRAHNTAAYVEKYLSEHGVHVPSGKIHTKGDGNPGNPPKPVGNNDQADRAAKLEIDAPAVTPEAPKHPTSTSTAHHPAPHHPVPKPAPHRAPKPAPKPAPPVKPASSSASTASTPAALTSIPSQPVILPTSVVDPVKPVSSSSSTSGSSAPFTLPTDASGGWTPPTTDGSWQAPTPFTGPSIGPGFSVPGTD